MQPSPPFPSDVWLAYEMLYNYTASAIVRADPLLSVGGPATAELGHVVDFLDFTGNGSVLPARFVSTHSYPTDYQGFNGTLTRTLYEDNIFAAAAPVAAAGLPFLMTEISSGWAGKAYDAPFSAAFIVHMAAAALAYPNIQSEAPAPLFL